ncbi:hypothetical protein [Thiocapsa sp. UBA6158]|jgi:hypothetical protein|uniref:hypothetical protein n=1 Tax=Thiocapsa sp. UBA6158 TaxID=1947692 RepID=UPI0025DFFC94|nr:hypothetical protein [Thiocapsa sp. UBA6158]
MAKALIIDDQYGKLALKYYSRFPEEPCFVDVTARVDEPELIPRTSLDTLLKAILKSWSNKSFPGPDLLLVSHGNISGLTMRLLPNHQTDSRTDVLETLLSHESDVQQATRLNLTVQQVKDLVDQIQRVQALGIGHVMFRGCTLGAANDNLGALRKLLGAKSISGPKVLSTYGVVSTVGILRTKTFDRYIAQRSAAHVSTFPEGRCAFVRVPGKGHQDTVVINVERTGTSDTRQVIIRQWLATFMSNMTPSLFQPWMLIDLPVHYLRTTPPILPLDKNYIVHIPRM